MGGQVFSWPSGNPAIPLSSAGTPDLEEPPLVRSRILTLLAVFTFLTLALMTPGARGDQSAEPTAPQEPNREQAPAASPSPQRTPLALPSSEADYSPTEGIWISDTDNGRIVYMKDLDGTGYYALGLSGRGPGRFLRPEQIWVDVEARIYVADCGNNRIVRFDDLRGAGWTEIRGLSAPTGVAAHGDRIFVSDTGADRVLVYREFGTEPVAVLSDPKLRRPGHLWVDLEGNLYVAAGEDPPGGRVVRIPVNLDAPPAQWQVYEGRGLNGNSFAPAQTLVTPHGMYLVDRASDRLVRVDDFSGRDARELGRYGDGTNQFRGPRGLSQDEEGRIFLADTGNDRVVRVDDIRGKGWTAYQTSDPRRSLRGPRSVYVWSPRPPKPTPSPSPSPKKK